MMHIKSIWHSFGYSGVLLSYVAVFTLLPLLQGYEISEYIVRILFTSTLLFSIYSVANHRVVLWLAMVLAMPHLIVDWGLYFDNSPTAQIVKISSLACFYSYVIFFFARHIFGSRVVKTNTILGAICVYLFIGTIWGSLYTLVEYIAPGSFVGLPPTEAATEANLIESQFLNLFYWTSCKSLLRRPILCFRAHMS